MSVREKMQAERQASESHRRELAKLYAVVARDQAGARVLADICNDLMGAATVDPSWPRYASGGQAHDAVGEVARSRAARRIDMMIRAGRSG